MPVQDSAVRDHDKKNKENSVALVVGDPSLRALILEVLGELGLRVGQETNVDGVPSVICADLDSPEGVRVLKQAERAHGRARVICIGSGHGVEHAVEAMRRGAYDYLVKPVDRAKLANSLRLAVRPAPASAHGPAHNGAHKYSIVGGSPRMDSLAAEIARVQQSDIVVYLQGETGTGKELVARAIHDNGPRRHRPFVAVNCASIPQQLQESELFGHERGAFTGAHRLHRGCFEQANGGTLFLDEVAEMSLPTQASLLRALEERRIRRLGGSSDVPVDIRVICATHRNMEEEMRAERFRKDLYFRLAVYPIHLPPLRNRIEDIARLVAHFLRKFASAEKVPTVDGPAIDALSQHAWPGNVRELENVTRRMLLAADGADEIRLEHLPAELRAQTSSYPPGSFAPVPENPQADAQVIPFRELERRAILRALSVADGRIDKAAQLLCVSRATLYRRLARFGYARKDEAPGQ